MVWVLLTAWSWPILKHKIDRDLRKRRVVNNFRKNWPSRSIKLKEILRKRRVVKNFRKNCNWWRAAAVSKAISSTSILSLKYQPLKVVLACGLTDVRVLDSRLRLTTIIIIIVRGRHWTPRCHHEFDWTWIYRRQLLVYMRRTFIHVRCHLWGVGAGSSHPVTGSPVSKTITQFVEKGDFRNGSAIGSQIMPRNAARLGSMYFIHTQYDTMTQRTKTKGRARYGISNTNYIYSLLNAEYTLKKLVPARRYM